MKSKIMVRILSVTVLCAIAVIVCLSAPVRLRASVNRYNRLLDGELPEDLTLTIYYVPSFILTRYPWSVEDLLKSESTVKRVVRSDELAKNLQTLKWLGSADWQPSDEDMYLNARIYYVFESGGKKVLEVALWTHNGEGENVTPGAMVNGIQVKDHTAFVAAVVPFLPKEHKAAMGLLDVPDGSVDLDE